MSYIIGATWVAKPGTEDEVAQVLAELAPLSRREPGVLRYLLHRSLENPRCFFLYEEYRDETAFQTHLTTPHFKHYVLDRAIPLLESRKRERYSLVE